MIDDNPGCIAPGGADAHRALSESKLGFFSYMAMRNPVLVPVFLSLFLSDPSCTHVAQWRPMDGTAASQTSAVAGAEAGVASSIVTTDRTMALPRALSSHNPNEPVAPRSTAVRA